MGLSLFADQGNQRGIFRHRIIGVERIPAKFDLATKATRERLREAIKREAAIVRDAARANTSAALNKRATGETASSIKVRLHNARDPDAIGASVGSSYYLFRFFERGYGIGKGPFRVRSYTRSNYYGRRFRYKAYYRRITHPALNMLMDAFNREREGIRRAIVAAAEGG